MTPHPTLLRRATFSRKGRRGALAGVIAIASPLPAFAEPSLSILPLPFAVTEFRGPASRAAQTAASADPYRDERSLTGQPLVALWGQGGGAAVVLAGSALRTIPARRGGGDMTRLERGRSAVPGVRMAALGPLTVTLEDPARDYPHEALGSALHPKTLVVAERRPAPPGPDPKIVPTETTRIAAGPNAVFEDREPRLVDLDGDGTPEILVVRSYADRGSALAVIGRRDGAWRVLAETPPDGEPFRWLNPVTVEGGRAGSRTIVLVRRPHLDGMLQLWTWSAGTLALAAERPGYSNHAFGQAAQTLAASFRTETGATRLALPTLDRGSLAILSLDGAPTELARIPLPARAATGVAALGTGAATHLLIGLEDGRVVDLRP